MRLWPVIVVCAVPAAAGIHFDGYPHLNRKLTSNRVAIRKAIVLPAEVTFEEIGTRGSEGGLPEAGQIGKSFYTAAVRELAARGVEVLPNPLEQARDDGARYAVADLQSRFNNIRVQLNKKPGQVEKGRYTLGERAVKFEPGAAADALVFLRGTGIKLTPGRTALGVAMMGWGVSPEFRGDITLVDAKTGEVLAYLRFNRSRDMTVKTGDRFADNVRRALHDVPLPAPPPKK